MNRPWDELTALIEPLNTFVLSSHIRPDGDALGSELGFASILNQMGKSVQIINPGQAPDHLQFLDPEKQIRCLNDAAELKKAVLEADCHVVLDTSAWAQLSSVGTLLKQSSAKKIVIDHHVSSDDLGAEEFKDTISPATGCLVTEYMQHLKMSCPEHVAQALYAAIATDTGWFRFPATQSSTMAQAGQLMDWGANPSLLYQLLYEQRTDSAIRLNGIVLSRVQCTDDGAAAFTYVTQEDFKQTKAHPADTEGLVNECLKIKGVKVAYIIVEQLNRTLKVSLRSRGEVDVAKLAEQFGGGGHIMASGATLQCKLEQGKQSVQKAVTEALVAAEKA